MYDFPGQQREVPWHDAVKLSFGSGGTRFWLVGYLPLGVLCLKGLFVLGVFLIFLARASGQAALAPEQTFCWGPRGSWPDRLSAPSRTAIAQEARDGKYDFIWSQYMKTKIIKLYKFFWTHLERRWVRGVQVKRTPLGYRPVRLLRRKNRISGNRRRLRKAQALMRKRRA